MTLLSVILIMFLDVILLVTEPKCHSCFVFVTYTQQYRSKDSSVCSSMYSSKDLTTDLGAVRCI